MKYGRTRGYTLIESLLVVAILGVASFMLSRALVGVHRHNIEVRNRLAAHGYAQETLEALHAVGAQR